MPVGAPAWQVLTIRHRTGAMRRRSALVQADHFIECKAFFRHIYALQSSFPDKVA
jgi:hypothetical protein